MTMTRQDYQIIANAIAREFAAAPLQGPGSDVAKLTLAYLSKSLAREFENHNPRFDADKFYNACFPD